MFKSDRHFENSPECAKSSISMYKVKNKIREKKIHLMLELACVPDHNSERKFLSLGIVVWNTGYSRISLKQMLIVCYLCF